MKKQIGKRALSLLLCLLLCLSFLNLSAAAAETVTLAKWDGAVTGTTPARPANSGVFQSDSVITISNGVVVNETGGSNSLWYNAINQASWQFALKTKGYENINLSFKVYGIAASPANWEVKYSTDGVNYFSYTPAKTYVNTALDNTAGNAIPISLDLGAVAADAELIYIRLVPESKTGTANTRLVMPITLTGTAIGGGPGPDPVDPTVISVAAANATAAGTSVTVKGVVTYLYANNSIMIQDGTGVTDGICVYKSGANLSAFVGKEIRVTGVRTDFNGLKELVPADVATDIVVTNETASYPPIPIFMADAAAGRYACMLISMGAVQITARNAAETVQSHTVTRDDVSVVLRAALPAEYQVGDWITISRGTIYMYNVPQIVCTADAIARTTAPVGDWETTGETASVAEWSFPGSSEATTMPKAATGGVNATGASLSTTATGNATFTANGAVNMTGWDGAAGSKYWQLSMSTMGFAKLSLAFSSQSSGTGPADFKVTYSVDGGATFHDFAANTFKVVNSFVGQNFTLPKETANATNLLVRIAINSTTNVNGTTTGSSGTSRIGGIVLTGEYILNENQVATVSASPASGAVALGTVVQLATTTAEATILVSDDDETYVPATSVTLDTLPRTIYVKAMKAGMIDSRVKSYTYTQAKLAVQAVPLSGAILPGSSVTLTTGEGATIYYTLTRNAGTPEAVTLPEDTYTAPITLTAEMFPVTIVARATGTGYLDSDVVTLNYTAKATGGEQAYFGQLHAHTTNSDGAGTLDEAFAWARDNAGLDFFAVTDHSNSFDTAPAGDKAGTYNLGAYNAGNVKWQNGVTAAASARRADYISVYGYEMTWSGGPGHINTFNTEGFVSRLNTELNSKTNDAGLRAYYELLKATPDAISQFNHPGTTFGNFSNFAYWDPIIDQYITLIEVGNGEGTIGSGGYFPSYEQYTLALDKGWHVAPTNNQDNHKKGWGTSNPHRTVIWTNDLSEAGLYQALRERRVYASEVSDLAIEYRANGLPLGTIDAAVPASVTFTADIKNPTAGNTVKSVSLITNGGVEIGKQTFSTQNVNYTFTLEAPEAGYYYLKVVDLVGGAERIAVTAPVWFGTGVSAGITEVTKSSVVPVTTEELTLTTSLFNVGTTAATLTSITYTDQVGTVLCSETPNVNIAAGGGSHIHTMAYTPATAGETTITVAAVMLIDGESKTFTRDITYTVLDIDKLTFIGIDGSHYNEYVSGNYKDNMGNFTALAGKYNVRVNILTTPEALIAAAANPQYKMLLLTAPSRRLYQNPAQIRSYEPEVIDAIAAFAQNGGTLILTGWSDLYENYAGLAGMTLEQHMASQQNKLLAAAGATLRLSDDAAGDTVYNPNTDGHYRMYLTGEGGSYHWGSPLLTGVDPAQQYSQYGGSTIHAVAEADRALWNAKPAATLPASVTPAVSTSVNGVSEDRDSDLGAGKHDMTIPRYDGKYLVLASETLTHENGKTSEVIVAGGAFMSNFEIQVEMDSYATLPYSNYNILSTLIQSVEPEADITAIADAKALPEGTSVTIEGIATSGVNTQSVNPDTNKGFFDCIYVQDATGGINLFPISEGVAEGQKIRVTGKLSSYQGEIQLAVTDVRVLDAAINPVAPTELSTAASMLPENTGLLVKVSGAVANVVKDEVTGVVNQFTVNDGTGAAIVYLNGYITSGINLDFVQAGAYVSVVGLASIGENFTSGDPLPRLRVRDRAEIVLQDAPADKTVADIRTDATSNVALPVAYTISLTGMKGVMNVRITFEVDGSMLASTGVEILSSEFTAMDPGDGVLRWIEKEDGTWQGEILLMFLGGEAGFTSAETVDVVKLFFHAKQLGSAAVTLTGLLVTGLDENFDGITLDSEIRTASATTDVIRLYSKYDLNKDGVVDERDLAMAQRYYQAAIGDPNWDAAKACDFNGDDEVNMLDLVDLFLNFGAY